MFDDIEVVLRLIEGSYKKLKSYYYYDKTMLFINKKIVELEATREIEDVLYEIAEKLHNEDVEYFNNLMQNISYVVIPKSFKSIENHEVIHGFIDKEKRISRLNFCIDMPIELYIIDCLWTILISKLFADKYGVCSYLYAARIKHGVIKNGHHFLADIDFESNRLYEPYFHCYLEWRNKAIKQAMKSVKTQDTIMFSLDLKSFYYNVEFDFEQLNIIFKGQEYSELDFLNKVIEKIYKLYTKQISGLKANLKQDGDKVIFPIGLLSPLILRDIYLKPIDEQINQKLSPIYYGRYVDDILIVVKGDTDNISSKESMIKTLLVDHDIIESAQETGEYHFKSYANLKLQSSKINIFYFQKGKDNVLLNVYLSKFIQNSSEANLLPDLDILNKSFISKAYNLNTNDESGKIRNIEFMNTDNYNATLFINGFKQILKNATFTKEKIEQYLRDILEFYSGSQAIEYSNTWRSVFELLVMCEDIDRINLFYHTIMEEIKKIDFSALEDSEIYDSQSDEILKRLKYTLQEKVNMSISLAMALDYGKTDNREWIDMAEKIRIANMLSHHLVSVPLINYTHNEDIQSMVSYLHTDLKSVFGEAFVEERKNLFKLKDYKIKWTPRFIHLNELLLNRFYSNIGMVEKFSYEDDKKIFEEYIKMNHINSKIQSPVLSDVEPNLIEKLRMRTIKVANYQKGYEALIGLVNTKVDEEDVLDNLLHPGLAISIENKIRLYKLLNAAKEQKVSYIIFPEFYMPMLWLMDISRFAKIFGITIITGLQYIEYNHQVFNVVCILQSTFGEKGFRNSIPLFREKNYYAPNEKLALAKHHFFVKDQLIPFYYLIQDGFLSYSIILCFEFTDIAIRYALKGKTDFICVPQLNRDTNYFSSIVESTSRDLHTVIVQANTSKYGDSRITAPFKTSLKDILKIKGGEEDVMIVGKIDWERLKKFRETYYTKLQNKIQKCLNCTYQTNKCKGCTNNKPDNDNGIKGLPPGWIE